MVIITTLITPLCLKWSLEKKSAKEGSRGGIDQGSKGTRKDQHNVGTQANHADSKPDSPDNQIKIGKR
jgi:hypothetical protein